MQKEEERARTMRVLFVYPDINVRGGARSYQFGIGMVSAMLKRHGHDTRLHYMFRELSVGPLKEEIEAYEPDVIAFSGVSPQYPFVRLILEELGRTEAFTVLGGQHATLVPDCIEENPHLDAVCIGEGEYPLLELVEAIRGGRPVENIQNLWVRRPDGRIMRNETRPFIADLDELPFPDREIFEFQKIVDSDFKTALFMFSRGCPYRCTFCSNHALRQKQTGRYVRFRSVQNCLQEIEEVVSKYDVRALYFNDDCFTSRRDFVIEFCKEYRSKFGLPFDINARPENLTQEICDVLKSAGCRRVSIGIECGSEVFRRDVLNRQVSNERIIEAFEACRRAGLKTKSFNIVGFPFETEPVFRETIELNRRANPDSVIIGIFEPYPGTHLSDVCIQEGFIDAARRGVSFVGRTDTVLNMPQFPREEILRCFRRFAFEVYRRHSIRKAVVLRVYYSRYGELLLRLVSPMRDLLRRLVMGV